MTTAAEHPWGRVDAEGKVFVKAGDSEREIGEWKVGAPAVLVRQSWSLTKIDTRLASHSSA